MTVQSTNYKVNIYPQTTENSEPDITPQEIIQPTRAEQLKRTAINTVKTYPIITTYLVAAGTVLAFAKLFPEKYEEYIDSPVRKFYRKNKGVIDLIQGLASIYLQVRAFKGPDININDPKRDLTQKAKDGEIQNISGRNGIIDEITETIFSQNKPNVLLIGDPGVGKTALVEGFAHYIIKEQANNNPKMKDLKLLEVKASEFMQGASFMGQFEARMENFIKKLENPSKQNLIIFIDEIHMLTHLTSGSTNAKDMLKPLLARGKARIIGATTTKEVSEIMADGALARRFHRIDLPAPSGNELVSMVRVRAQDLANHHKCIITAASIREAIELTKGFPGHYPDKAITAIDLAAAKISLENALKRGRTLGSINQSGIYVPGKVQDRKVTPGVIQDVTRRERENQDRLRAQTHTID